MNKEERHIWMGKVLAGELNEEENKAFQAWLLEDPARMQEFEQMKNIWGEKIFSEVSQDEVDEASKRLLSKMKAMESETVVYQLPYWKRPQLVAAAAVLVLLSVIGLSQYKGDNIEELYAGIGEQQKITLSDGTVVTLNSESTLYYPNDFESSIREVRLEGEALFEVSENPHKPFVVKAAGLEVQVLGTVFNVDAYHDNINQTVELLSGKIALKNSNAGEEAIVLNPGDLYTYNNREKNEQLEHNYNGFTTDWLRGELNFNKKSLEEVVLVLQREYPIEIILENREAKGKKLTASFQHSQPAEEIISLLAVLTGHTLERKGNTYFLK
ncbi:FecR domain-containing protein [Limibacter armeniacum]|uniref:FecR domain-containing protein n=1 Tax=Limibacter armeniacum TaxID=466084 RepID=UPI002FE5987B